MFPSLYTLRAAESVLAPVALFQTRIYGGGAVLGAAAQYDVSGDGRFLINTVLDDAGSPITLLQNWAAGLQK